MGEPRYHEALGLLIQVAMAFNDDMSRSFARDGLTGARAHALWELRRTGPITQRALADALGVTARTVTGLVDGMVATGFVTREPHPTDRRATLVTPDGARDRGGRPDGARAGRVLPGALRRHGPGAVRPLRRRARRDPGPLRGAQAPSPSVEEVVA